MKKHSIAKTLLQLNRETIRKLTVHESSQARGGVTEVTDQTDTPKTTTSMICTAAFEDVPCA